MDILNGLLEDPEDLDCLLEYAGLVRDAVEGGRLADLRRLIRYSAEHGYHEALYWAMGILDETCARSDGTLADFECVIGRSIPDYNGFISRMGIDLNAYENDVRPVRDENGEVQAFFNIIRYQTAFAHIELVTSENFDARDNDYIQYLLVCR